MQIKRRILNRKAKLRWWGMHLTCSTYSRLEQVRPLQGNMIEIRLSAAIESAAYRKLGSFWTWQWRRQISDRSLHFLWPPLEVIKKMPTSLLVEPDHWLVTNQIHWLIDIHEVWTVGAARPYLLMHSSWNLWAFYWVQLAGRRQHIHQVSTMALDGIPEVICEMCLTIGDDLNKWFLRKLQEEMTCWGDEGYRSGTWRKLNMNLKNPQEEHNIT